MTIIPGPLARTVIVSRQSADGDASFHEMHFRGGVYPAARTLDVRLPETAKTQLST